MLYDVLAVVLPDAIVYFTEIAELKLLELDET
jgi:hypothetical protein